MAKILNVFKAQKKQQATTMQKFKASALPSDIGRYLSHTAHWSTCDKEPWDDFVLSCCEYIGQPVKIRESKANMLCLRYILAPVNLDSKKLIRQREKLELLFHTSCTMSLRPDGAVDLIIPHSQPTIIHFGDIFLNGDFEGKKLPLCIGYDMDGQPVIKDLAKLPHLLVAGQTGAGKSILLHNLICSLLLKTDAAMYLIDPKLVELGQYKSVARCQVINDNDKAICLLRKLCELMDARYQLLCKAGCRDIDSYIASGGNMRRKILVVDELADLLESGTPQIKREICGHLQRIGQKARACGIHMILCTQSPRKEVLPGIIKANMPAKICLRVSNQNESMVVLGNGGGEKLRGQGHMIFQFGLEKFECQSGLITDQEIKNVVSLVKQ